MIHQIEMPVSAARRNRGRIAAGLLLLAGMAALTGCLRVAALKGSERVTVNVIGEPRPVHTLDVPLTKDPTKIYRIGPSDVMRIDVRKDPSLSLDYVVTDEGNILLPNIGPFPVANLTAAEVEQKINEMLTQYIREPDAKVGIREYRSKVIYVVGNVGVPGPQVMKADMLTLQDAMFAAGLPTPEAAIQRAQVISPALENPVVRQIDLTDILYKGKMKENILLKPNDIVYVPAKSSSTLGATIRELLTPVEEYYNLQFQASFGRNYGGN
ncbi:MAG: polysaccharide export protein [bacterium]|nr:polysaccharide export protein [bacterium]